MSKAEFKKTIEELVAKFDRNIDRYKDQSSSFNETQLRIEFIDPMFEALGWDMNNKAGAAEQYKEVIHEDKVYIEGKPKAPDYSFKFWGERKFFLEAKQPFVKIKTDYKPALQLRRYAWSAHLPVSILTDFEELAIYDTTIEPKATDQASVSRLQYYKYTDYLDKCEEIYDLFAKESIQQGSFDKFIAKEKRGSQLVDKVFLKEIENWREWLAKDIAKQNSELTVEGLNFAVQKIIDRIIFLRIAEDRGIERYKSLENIIKSKNSYPELVRYFKTAHEKYNSGLFDFEEDTITPELKVSDKLLDKILEHLYYPNSPYEFSVLGVELLGSIYEQFLGKVIRLTAGHNAKVEEKPEVKKAGGVFYTPQYIVEYIVKNTVGELLNPSTGSGLSIKQAEKIKVLDPACGSGSFLIGAYEFLLNWHLAEYEKLSDKEKEKLEKKGVIYKQVNKESTGESIESWQLTTNEKKRIMLNNIYGVDIDSQAVEVTKLSLALKMLENENQQSINKQMKLFAERILPDMSGNIKCGNSLVGSDYWEDKDLSEVSEKEIKKVNAFDWDVEFKEIMDKGGFDAVIGNPPYVRQESIKEMKPYLQEKYETYNGISDLYVYFFEKGMKVLRKEGLFSFIVSDKFTRAGYGKGLRKFLSDNYTIVEYTKEFEQKVFDNASVDPCIITIQNKKSKSSDKVVVKKGSDKGFQELMTVSADTLGETSWNFVSEKISNLISKIESTGTKIKDIEGLQINYGIKTGFNDAFVINESKKNELIEKDPKSAEIIKPLLRGRDIGRYVYRHASLYLINSHNGYFDTGGEKVPPVDVKNEYPAIYEYLVNKNIETKGKVEKRYDQGKHWTNLRNCKYAEDFEKPKIVFSEFGYRFQGCLDTNQVYILDTSHLITTESSHILAILNSKLALFYMQLTLQTLGKKSLRFKPTYIENFPIDESVDERFDELVENQLTNHKALAHADSESKKQLIQKQIEATDEKINKLVYELYGLTQEEIDVIEGAG